MHGFAYPLFYFMDLYLLTQQWTKEDKCHMDNCVGLKSYDICYFNTFSCRCLRSGSNNMIRTRGVGVNDDLYAIFEHLGTSHWNNRAYRGCKGGAPTTDRIVVTSWQAATCGSCHCSRLLFFEFKFRNTLNEVLQYFATFCVKCYNIWWKDVFYQ